MNIRKFTSCFIGIPLPDKYQKEFSDLLNKIQGIIPDIEVAYDMPHITVYYLDEQSQDHLSEIENIVRGHTNLVKGFNLNVRGMGLFGEELPRVLFLPVDYPAKLADFNKLLSRNLTKFMTEDNNLPFHPHMTVARFKTAQAQSIWEKVKESVEQEMKKIHWQFPITEVAIYGVDSTKNPQYQEKLITFSASS